MARTKGYNVKETDPQEQWMLKVLKTYYGTDPTEAGQLAHEREESKRALRGFFNHPHPGQRRIEQAQREYDRMVQATREGRLPIPPSKDPEAFLYVSKKAAHEAAWNRTEREVSQAIVRALDKRDHTFLQDLTDAIKLCAERHGKPAEPYRHQVLLFLGPTMHSERTLNDVVEHLTETFPDRQNDFESKQVQRYCKELGYTLARGKAGRKPNNSKPATEQAILKICKKVGAFTAYQAEAAK